MLVIVQQTTVERTAEETRLSTPTLVADLRRSLSCSRCLQRGRASRVGRRVQPVYQATKRFEVRSVRPLANPGRFRWLVAYDTQRVAALGAAREC